LDLSYHSSKNSGNGLSPEKKGGVERLRSKEGWWIKDGKEEGVRIDDSLKSFSIPALKEEKQEILEKLGFQTLNLLGG